MRAGIGGPGVRGLHPAHVPNGVVRGASAGTANPVPKLTWQSFERVQDAHRSTDGGLANIFTDDAPLANPPAGRSTTGAGGGKREKIFGRRP
jgi:hypothetical protein